MIYDLTRQWILKDGPFEYDYGWLSQSHTNDELADWVKGAFERLYGVSPDDFEILQ